MSTQPLSPKLLSHALVSADLQRKKQLDHYAVDRKYDRKLDRNSRNLQLIEKRLEHSREIITNLDRKRFHLFSPLSSLPLEFQWLQGNFRPHMYFFNGRISQAGLYLKDTQDGKVKHAVHPIFYTGSTHEISNFARKIFYRENLSRVGQNLSHAEFQLHSYLYLAGNAETPSFDISPAYGTPFWNSKKHSYESVVTFYKDRISEQVNTLVSQSSKYAEKVKEERSF